MSEFLPLSFIIYTEHIYKICTVNNIILNETEYEPTENMTEMCCNIFEEKIDETINNFLFRF